MKQVISTIKFSATVSCAALLLLALIPSRLLAQDASSAAPSAPAYGSAGAAASAPGAVGSSLPATAGATAPVAPQLDFGTTLSSVSPLAEIGTGTVAAKNYALGPGDMINVFVAPQGKYSASGMVITQDGFVDYPVLGRIPAAGKTAEELSSDITLKLAEYCINPNVNVNVVALHPEVVYVTGGGVQFARLGYSRSAHSSESPYFSRRSS